MRRGELLRALRAAGPAGVSGEVLAAEFGVSRAAVAKHVRALREMGYGIDAVAGTGYRLDRAPDLPLPEEVAHLVRNPFWVRYEGGLETASTNDDAKLLARAGAPEGTVVLAARQTAGRGRLGRVWDSPSGGAYLSAVFRPNLSPADLAPLPLVVALGVARGLERVLARAAHPGPSQEPAAAAPDATVAVKWPNDVWFADRDGAPVGKVAGVLLEMQAESDMTEWVVAGVGVNVRAGSRGFAGAAYVTDHVPNAHAAGVAAAVLDGIAATYAAWTIAGFDGLVDEYDRIALLRDRWVNVRDADGALRVSGVASGIDGDGRLLVDSGGRTVVVSAGDVTLREDV